MSPRPFHIALSVAALLASLCLAQSALAGSFAGGSLIMPTTTLAFTTPSGPNVEVQPADALNGLVLAPNSPNPIPASQLVMTIRNASNDPIPGATVVVQLGPDHNICPDTDLVTTTDADGVAHLTLAGGGCSDGIPLSGLIKANGVTIRSYDNVKSPDFDGVAGDGISNFADLIVFANEFLGTSPSECHDYDNDGLTGLDDLIIFAPTFINYNQCP